MPTRKPISYKDAGVNIDEANRAVGFIKVAARKTFTRGVMSDIGSFGAGFRLAGWKRPVLISSADGVGTKSHRRLDPPSATTGQVGLIELVGGVGGATPSGGWPWRWV